MTSVPRGPRMALLLLLAAVPVALASEGPTVVELNTAGAEALAALPGMSAELARAIVAWREKHGPFDRPEDVRKVPGVSEKIWVQIQPRLRALPPVIGATPAGADTAGERPTASIIAVANYFAQFDGLDLQALPPNRRQEFLETVNGEPCVCGCVGDTMARCYVNDPGCPVAKARLRALYKELLAAEQADPTDEKDP